MKRRLLAEALERSGLRRALGRAPGRSGVLTLTYHRIGDGSRSPYDREVWSATADDFDEQVAYCKANFDVIAPADLPDALARRKGRHLLITFDDGYEDNSSAAFPILRRHGVPATFFISTGYIDDPRLTWWDEISWMVRNSPRESLDLPGWFPEPVPLDAPDRPRAIRTLLRRYTSLPIERTAEYLDDLSRATGIGRPPAEAGRTTWMTWDMIRALRDGGMTIGGHTVSHPILARCTPERQQEEIAGCLRRLAEELGQPVDCFSYPVGDITAFNEHTRDALRRAGVRHAFSYYGGYRTHADWDDLDIRRISVESEHNRAWFRAMTTWPGLFAPAYTEA